jgi:hypothetical protein
LLNSFARNIEKETALKTRLSILVSLVGIVLSAVFSDPCFAATVQEVIKTISTQSPAQRKKTIEDGARKEGQFVIYTSLSDQDNPKVMAAFEKSYPFVKTEVYRGTPRSALLKASTEARAGRFAVDIVATAPSEMWQLKQSKLSNCLSVAGTAGDAEGIVRPGRLLVGL